MGGSNSGEQDLMGSPDPMSAFDALVEADIGPVDDPAPLVDPTESQSIAQGGDGAATGGGAGGEYDGGDEWGDFADAGGGDVAVAGTAAAPLGDAAGTTKADEDDDWGDFADAGAEGQPAQPTSQPVTSAEGGEGGAWSAFGSASASARQEPAGETPTNAADASGTGGGDDDEWGDFADAGGDGGGDGMGETGALPSISAPVGFAPSDTPLGQLGQDAASVEFEFPALERPDVNSEYVALCVLVVNIDAIEDEWRAIASGGWRELLHAKAAFFCKAFNERLTQNLCKLDGVDTGGIPELR